MNRLASLSLADRPLNFFDDDTLGYMMQFFRPQDALRFSRTSQRNRSLFKANELKLRPIDHIRFMRYPFLVSEGDEEESDHEQFSENEFSDEEFSDEEEYDDEFWDEEDGDKFEYLQEYGTRASFNMITFKNSNIPPRPHVYCRRDEQLDALEFEFLEVFPEEQSLYASVKPHFILEKSNVRVEVKFNKCEFSFTCYVYGGTQGDARKILLSYMLCRVHFDTIETDDRCRAPTKNFLAPLYFSYIKELSVDCRFVSLEGLFEILDRCPNVHTLRALQEDRDIASTFPKEFFANERIQTLKSLEVSLTRSELTQESILALKATTLVLYNETSLTPLDLDAVLQAWKTGKRPIESWEISLTKPICLKSICRRFGGRYRDRDVVLTSQAGTRLRISFDENDRKHVRLSLSLQSL